MPNRAELSRKEILASARQGPETLFYTARHGATWQNAEAGISQDRERSWSYAPLTAQGAEEARKIGLKLKDRGIGAIFCSDLPRSCETAGIIGEIVDVEPRGSSKLRPWNLGKITNQLLKDANAQIRAYAKDKPDMPVPEGESFNDFKRRCFRGIAESIGKYPGKTVLLVSHLRVESLLRAWQAAGQPISHKIDIETFLRPGDPPGSFRTFTTWMPLLWGELDNKLTHAEAKFRKGYEPEWCRTCEYSDHADKPTCGLVEDIYPSGWCRLWEKAE